MSSEAEIKLNRARDTLETVVEKAERRIERASRLYGVMQRKTEAQKYAAARNRGHAARRVLDEAESLLSEYEPHRTAIHRHVESHPQIEGGVYHSYVQSYDATENRVTGLLQRLDMEQALLEHQYDLRCSDHPRPASWQAQYDAVRETIGLLEYISQHDIPGVLTAIDQREHTQRLQYPTDGFIHRLGLLRKQMATIDSFDHETVATNAAAVNSQLAADYRGMIDRLQSRYRTLKRQLPMVASVLLEATE